MSEREEEEEEGMRIKNILEEEKKT